MSDSLNSRKTWSAAMRYLSTKDRTMSKLVKKKGYVKISLHKNYYEALLRSIIYQQISGAAAASIVKRLHGVYGGNPPTPEEFLATRKSVIRAAGISPQKFSYIYDLSKKIVNGEVELKKFYKLPNETIINELDSIRGIGRWTAEMFLMFSLGRVDVLPFDDYGIRKSIKRVYHLRELPDKARMKTFAARWAPYNSIASIYLWEDEGVKEPKRA